MTDQQTKQLTMNEELKKDGYDFIKANGVENINEDGPHYDIKDLLPDQSEELGRKLKRVYRAAKKEGEMPKTETVKEWEFEKSQCVYCRRMKTNNGCKRHPGPIMTVREMTFYHAQDVVDLLDFQRKAYEAKIEQAIEEAYQTGFVLAWNNKLSLDEDIDKWSKEQKRKLKHKFLNGENE